MRDDIEGAIELPDIELSKSAILQNDKLIPFLKILNGDYYDCSDQKDF